MVFGGMSGCGVYTRVLSAWMTWGGELPLLDGIDVDEWIVGEGAQM